MKSSDTYIVTTSRGEPAVRTNSHTEAVEYQLLLGGEILEQNQEHPA